MTVICGIIGLPNVGKSTLFNILTDNNVKTENYPFCTINPNIGIFKATDIRIQKLSHIIHNAKIIDNKFTLIDIAGLIHGAHKGEGLGNNFLNHIKKVDIIFHIIRCFKDKNITHINNRINPVKDINIINTELMLSDYNNVLNSYNKQKNNQHLTFHQKHNITNFLHKLLKHLNQSNCASSFNINEYQQTYKQIYKQLQLLTSKPILMIINITSNIMNDNEQQQIKHIKKIYKYNNNIKIITIPIVQHYMYKNNTYFQYNYNIKIIKKCLQLIKNITFFTIKNNIIQSWIIKQNSLAIHAAKLIHKDFQIGFINVKVLKYKDLSKYNNIKKCQDHGLIRLEGKNYIIQEGDILEFYSKKFKHTYKHII